MESGKWKITYHLAPITYQLSPIHCHLSTRQLVN